MANDSHGMGIPLPADSTKITDFPRVARDGFERVAEVLAGGMTEGIERIIGNAAGSAVDEALDRADVITGDDTRAPQRVDSAPYAWAVADPQGRAPLMVDNEGKTIAHGGLETPSLNDIRFMSLPAETGYVAVWADSELRPALGITAAGELDFIPSAATINRLPIPKTGRSDPRRAGGSDLFLIIGQSNAQGGGLGYDPAVDIGLPGLNQFAGSGNAKGTISPAKDSLFHYNQWVNSAGPLVGPGMELGRQAFFAAPADREILLVPAALGSTSISGSDSYSWDPSNTTAAVNLFTAAQKQIRAAMKTHPGNRLAGIVWVQGEGDTGKLTEAQYLAKLQQICDLLRAEFGASVPFLVGSMVPEWFTKNDARAAIDRAHRAMATTRPFTAYVLGPRGMNQDDTLHYNAAGARELGRRLFDALPAAKANTLGL